MFREENHNHFWPCFLLLATAGFLYVQSFGFSWTYDDVPVVIENVDIRSLANFFENRYPGRPLRELSYMLDYALFANNPAGYHLQQILWHWLCAVLVYFLLQQLGVDQKKAWASALIFIVHPIQVETVASVGHRKECLALCFALLGLMAYLKALASEQWKVRWKWVFLALICFIVGLNAKQNLALIPLVCILYEMRFVAPTQRLFARFRSVNRGIIAGICLGAIGWVVYLYENKKFLANIAEIRSKLLIDGDLTVAKYYYGVIKGAGFMFSKVVFPWNLTPEYNFAVPNSFFDPWVVGTLILMGSTACFLYFKFVEDRALYLSALLIVAFWLPVSNLPWYLAYPAADRYMYAPMAGLAYILVSGVSWLVLDRRLAKVCFYVTVLLLFWISFMQSNIWRDTYALASHMHELYPQAEAGLIGLGSVALDNDQLDPALEYFLAALEVNPLNSTTYNNIGSIFFKKEQFEKSVEFYEKSIEFDKKNALAYVNLGTGYLNLGLYDKGIETIREGLSVNPLMVSGYSNIAYFYLSQNDYENCEKIYQEGILNVPEYPGFFFHYGKLLVRQQRYSEAIAMFESAAKLTPDLPDPYVELLSIADLVKDEKLASRQTIELDRIKFSSGNSGLKRQ